jgi:hypothetical protein
MNRRDGLSLGDRRMARSRVSPLLAQVGRVRRRLFLQALLSRLVGCWTAALVLSAGWFLCQPFAVREAPDGLRWIVLGSLTAIATLLALALTILRAPSAVTAALSLDERFNLKERVTTSLTLGPTEVVSPAGQALLADTQTRVAPLRVAYRFPVRPPRSALLLPAALIVVLLLAWFYHPRVAPARADGPTPLAEEPVVKADIEQKMRQLQKKPLSRPGVKPKSDELQRLEAELDRLARQPHETREQARDVVKEMTGAENQVRQREKELAERAAALKEQLRQAARLSQKSPKEGPGKKLDRAMERGDVQKAREEMEKLGQQMQADAEADRLRKKLKDEPLTDQQKKEMREQLEKLEKQGLNEQQKQQLAEQMKDLQDKLERLVRSDEAKERLRELERQGAISKEQLDRELNQLEKNMPKLDAKTLEQLQKLADKLAQCQKCMQEGKEAEAAQKMAEAAGMLKDMDCNGECRALAEKLRDLQNAREAMCRALDGKRDSPPGGKPNPAMGRRPEAKDGDTQSKEEWARSELDRGRLQVIDQAPGDGFKGPRKPAEMADEIRQAAQEAPEGLDRQRLPRSASDMARGYFEKLRGPDRDRKEK